METKDIWILFAGAALGYIGNLIATFTAPAVSSILGTAKRKFIERNKTKALLSFFEVKALKTGVRDKHLYALNSWGFVLVYMSIFFTCVIIGGLNTEKNWDLIFLIGSLLPAFLAIRRLGTLLLTLDRLQNFDQYEATLEKKWPDITEQSSASIVDGLQQPRG